MRMWGGFPLTIFYLGQGDLLDFFIFGRMRVAIRERGQV